MEPAAAWAAGAVGTVSEDLWRDACGEPEGVPEGERREVLRQVRGRGDSAW